MASDCLPLAHCQSVHETDGQQAELDWTKWRASSMNEGHFIGLKDRTTCGGVVLDGDIRIMLYGLAHAREGDRVTCGKDGKTYRIVGGVAHIVSHGKPLAGTLDSFSNCPCKAQLIPSVFTATYERQVDPAPGATLGIAQPTTPPATRHSI